MVDLQRLVENIYITVLLVFLPDCLCRKFGIYQIAEEIIEKREADNGSR